MRSIGLLLFAFIFGFITLSNAQNGSAGQPFTSLGQAQNVASDGVYYFSLSGTNFSTYVRVGGWVQVAIDFESGVGNLPQSNALNNTVRGILTPTALSTLGSATVTRLLTSNGQLDVQNTRPGIITRIVNNQTLLAIPADNTDNGTNWTGTNTLATQFTNYGNTTAYGLHSNFFHAGNNGDGIHWIPFFNMQQIKTSAGEIPNGTYFQLLVRAPMVAVVVGPTINTQPSSTAQNLCINSAANALSVSATSPNGSAITYQWYSNTNASNSNGTAIGGATSSSYTPPSNVVGTKYYYVICTNSQGSSTSNVSAGITIQGASVGGTASSNQTVCVGSSPANLTLASNTGSIQWQSSSDNINFNNIPGATSATLTSGQMGAINATTYYRAIVTNGSCAAATSNTITINTSSSPTLSSTTGASRCGTGTVTLQATTATGTINWYAASTGGASLGTGTSYTTPSINATTTFYADVINNGCTSTPRTAVVATVNAAPPTPTITQSGCGVLTLGNYNGGNALDFGTFNSSSYVTIPASLNSVFNTNNITLEGWFKFDLNSAGFPMLIGEAFVGDGKITFCMHKQGNNINAGFYNNAWTVVTSASTIQYNTWMHIAATYDQSSIKIYINGNLDATLNANAALPTGSESWYIGKRWDSNDVFRGVMDEIRVWNVARTQAQIQSTMNTTVPTNSTGLRAYYKLDESTGTSTADATGNGYNGTLTSGSTWQVPSTSVLAGPTSTILWSPTNQTTSVITAANSGTYTAVLTTASGCQSTPVSATVSIGVTAGSNQTICSGTSPANLTLTGTTTTIQWQSSTDNVNFTNIAGATSATLTSGQMGTLNTTTYYRANVTNTGCAASTSNTVTITVNTSPSFTNTTGASICGTGTVTLQATTATGTINWYAASTGGASLGTGTSFTTPSIASTTTYYAAVTNNGCTSNPRTAVVATVSAAPPTPTITQSNCGLLTLGNYGSGNALNLGVSNTSKYVSIPSSLNTSFNTNNITVEGWFNLSAADPSLPEPMLIGEAYISDNKVTFMLSRFSNQIRAGFFSTTWSIATSASNIPANTWTHIAATYDQTSIKIYINGVLDATLNATAPIPTGNEVWYLGKRFGGPDMVSGLMDEVRIWNVARTQAQIQTSMNTNIPVNSTGLRAYYKLDESTGTLASDATGNGHDGTLMNGPTWQVPSTSILGGPPVSFLWSPTGQTTNSITAATSGTYSAVVTNAAGCQSASISSSIIVGVTASSNQTICSGTSPANLTLTGSATTIQWQSSTDNINFTNIAGATSATLTAGQMGTLNTTTYYRANVTNTGCAASTSNTVIITVNPTPSFTNTTGASICGTGTVTLQATAATGTINWYAALTGGASLGTGTSYTTPSINATTTYYADVTNNGCTSNPRTAVVATVSAPPTPTITQTGCGTLSIGNLSSNALDLGVYNSSKYVTIPATLNSTINTNNITLEGWFYFTSLVANTNYLPMLIGEAYNIDANITFCMHRQGNTIIAGFYNGGWQAASSSTLIPINTWIHIAATYDQNQIKLYFNGVLNASFNSNQPLPISNNQPWYLGKRWDHLETLGGAMDEIRIWNVARTQAQIQASMNSTVPTNSVGLRAYYKLDESTGNTASDATGNGYDGTLNNGPTWQVPSTSPLNTNGNNYTYLWSPGGQTTSSITPVTSGTYSAVVTNAAGCQSASISSSIIVGVTASSNQTVCSGTAPANLTLSGSTTTVQWQSSTDNITFTNIAGATSTTLTSAQMGTLNSTRYYRATYTNGACPSSTSTTVTITVNPTPSFTNTTGASICGGPSVSTLQASAATGTINWYAALTGGASLGTGTSYTTPSIAATTTYYVDVTNNGCTSTPRTAVVATVNTLPLAVSNASGAIDYLVVGGGGGGGFDGAGGGGGGQVKMGSTTLSSGTFAVTIGNGGANATSYGSQASNGGTTTLSLPTPIVSIGGGGGGSKGANGATGGNGGGGGHSNYAGAAGAVGGFAGGIANGDGGGGGGGAGTAGATGSAGRNGGDGVSSSISGSATYYGGGGGGGSYGSTGTALGGLGGGGRGGLAFTPLAVAGTPNTGGGGGGAGEAQSNPGKSGGSGVVIVRYAGAQNGTGGIITTAGGFTIHTFNSNGSFVFNGVSSSAVVPHMSSCGASAITFTGTSLGAGITLDWYDAATGGNLLSQGTTTYTTPVISTTTTYYVAARNTSTGCVSATRTAVVATINAIPTIAGTTGASICVSGTVTLQATTAAGTINWYAASTGGASLGTGTSFTTPSINTTTTYYADVTNNGCTSAPRTAVVATVNALPTFTSTTGASICGTGTATLQAAAATGTINWYAASIGGVSLGTGTSYTTPSIASTTTYYAAVTNNGCTSNPRTAVVATVNSIPTITSSTGATICVSGTGTLQAAAAAGTINWYAVLTGGASLGTGTSYVTPNIATTTTYYADVTTNGCTSSPRTSIVATVIPSSSASSNQTVCPGLLPSAITLTNYSGTIQWQTSSNNSTFTNIAGQTAATLPANAIGIMSGTKYIRAMVTNGACVTPSNVVTLSPANVNVLTPLTASSYVWNGQSSSDWGTLSNWYSYNGTSLVPAATLPGSTANTIIPANTGCILTQPTLSSGAIIINSLVLETGSQLTQSGGSLLLYTNLVKNGNIVSTGGLINFYGPTSATISGSGAVQFAKMRINKLTGATLTLQIPVTVSDSLTMIAGNIYTTTNNLLTLGLNSATAGKLAYTNGTIVGPFKRFFANASTVGNGGMFPVGTATYNRYAQFSFASSPGVDQSLTVNYASGAPLSGGNILYNGLPHWASGSLMQNYSADGYWNVIPTNNDYTSTINSSPYDVTLFANNLTGMQTPQVCRIIKSAGSNTAGQHHTSWQSCGTHTPINGGASPLSFLISSTAVQGFSWFNIGTPNSQALPVEFEGMTTACEDQGTRIKWSTATEHYNDYFRVEESTTGFDWNILGYIDAVGNSTTIQWYEFMDATTRSNRYYRLFQVDLDGSEELLSTLFSDCDIEKQEIATFPNPSHESFSIYWKQFNTSGDGNISIRDINGKIMFQETVPLSLGANLFIIKEHLAPGIYLIELMDDNSELRLIKHVVN